MIKVIKHPITGVLGFFLTLKGRTFWTSQDNFDDVILFLQNKVTKWSDIPKLLEEHSYLFQNCHPRISMIDTKEIINNLKKHE